MKVSRFMAGLAGFALCFSLSLSACSTYKESARTGDQAVIPPTMPAGIFEEEILAAQNNHVTRGEITCTLPVKRMLPPDNSGERHEKFLLQMSNGSTILVAHNTSRAPAVPIAAGDVVTIHGEYIWNAKGGVIHWTHLSDTPSHPSGYIDFRGQRYQ